MLYKYLFYSVSYVIKKYDNLWRVGDIYYVWGAMIVGIMIAGTIMGLMDVFGIIFFRELIWSKWKIFAFLPLALGLLSTMYFGYHKRHEAIYEEVATMDAQSKKKYKVLNIIHIIVVNVIYFNTLALLNWINNHCS